MRLYWYVVLTLFMHIHSSIQKSTPESLSYVAAVVEYSPDIYNSTGGSKKDVLLQNAEHYIDIIKQAANKSADIVVFPECGLATIRGSTTDSSIIPEPEDGINPCYNQSSGVHEAVRLISCAARENDIYVVINIPEKKSCATPSHADCVLHYNTDVAFDRNGNIIARYRKYNLFGEPGYNITDKPDISTFDTDFGVKFGIFTCFDIMFEKPAVTLIKEHGITDIIFPTAWFSELPFLSAVQQQAAWAQGLGVNFLGSGYNNPSGGSTGTGIYSASQGTITSIMATIQTTKLLVAPVPKISIEITNLQEISPIIFTDAQAGGESKVGILMKRDFLEPYTTFLIDEDVALKKTLCHGEFCCDFDLKLSSTNNSGYFYRLAVFDGVRSFVFKTGGIQICAVIFCTNEKLSSCGMLSKDPDAVSSTFDYINIVGEFRLKGAVQLPNTLINGYAALSPTNYNFVREENSSMDLVKVQMLTKTPQTSLLTFGIYGRDFLKDGQPAESRNSGSEFLLSLLTITITCSLVLFNMYQY